MTIHRTRHLSRINITKNILKKLSERMPRDLQQQKELPKYLASTGYLLHVTKLSCILHVSGLKDSSEDMDSAKCHYGTKPVAMASVSLCSLVSELSNNTV